MAYKGVHSAQSLARPNRIGVSSLALHLLRLYNTDQDTYHCCSDMERWTAVAFCCSATGAGRGPAGGRASVDSARRPA